MQLPPDAPQAAQSAQSTAAVHRAAAPAPSMARERLCWAPWTGPTNGRRVSGVTSHLYTSPTRSAVPDDAQTLRCQALLRADRPGHAHPQPGAPSTWSAAFRARLRNRTRMLLPKCEGTVNSRCSSDSRSGSRIADGLPAHDVPVAGRELHASCGGREAATGGGHRASGVIPRVAGRPRTQRVAQRWRSRRRPAPGDRSPGRAATWADAGALSQIALAASAPSRPPPPRNRGSSRSRTASPNMFRL